MNRTSAARAAIGTSALALALVTSAHDARWMTAGDLDPFVKGADVLDSSLNSGLARPRRRDAEDETYVVLPVPKFGTGASLTASKHGPEHTFAQETSGVERSASDGSLLAQAFVTRKAQELPHLESSLTGPMRVAQEHWQAARDKTKESVQLAQWLNGQRKGVDRWISGHRERADLVGGWIHDYVEPTSGTPMKWTENSPEPTQALQKSEPRVVQAWAAHMRQRNISYALTAARLYRLTDEKDYGNWAMGQLDFYAANYERWPLRTMNGRGRMFQHGLDEAYNIFPLLEVARLLGELAGPARLERWRTGLFYPMAMNLRSVTSPLTNVGLWHAAGIAAIAMRFRDSELLEYAIRNPIGIRETLRQGITADNIWFEGSLGYNAYVLDCLSKLLTAASLEGYAESFQSEWNDAKRLLLAPLDYRFEDGLLPTPGDTDGKIAVMEARSNYLMYRIVPTIFGVRQASATITWDSLLDPPIQWSSAEYKPPEVVTRNFPGNRMAVLRAGSWQTFVHYGQSASNHAQEEALNYEIYFGRTPVTTDSGTVAYSSPYHQNYFRRAAAQNVPLIDGNGQSKWGPGKVLAFDSAASLLDVEHERYRSDFRVRRTFQTKNDGFSERTIFEPLEETSKKRRLGIAFHTACSIEPQEGMAPVDQPGPLPGGTAAAYWKTVASYIAKGNWSVILNCGGTRLALRVVADNAQRLVIASAPTTPLPSTRNVIYYEVEANRATFETSIRSAQ